MNVGQFANGMYAKRDASKGCEHCIISREHVACDGDDCCGAFTQVQVQWCPGSQFMMGGTQEVVVVLSDDCSLCALDNESAERCKCEACIPEERADGQSVVFMPINTFNKVQELCKLEARYEAVAQVLGEWAGSPFQKACVQDMQSVRRKRIVALRKELE